MPKESILIVDDEKGIRDCLEVALKREGYRVDTAPSGETTLELCGKRAYDLVIADIKMPGMDGVELLKRVKGISPDAIVLMITAYASVDTAIEAMKSGAYDYISKPFKMDEIRITVRKALEERRLKRENILLKRELGLKYGFGGLVGTSPKMLEVYELIKGVSHTTANVLITGESGTGKELVARAIHYEGDRKDGPFVPINCGAIPENLLESELFGHQKGAFTGAIANKRGLFEVANGGTIFLDEVTELPLHLQVKLMRVIQERSFRRVGGIEDISVDVRIISASNKDVAGELREGRFREDLFYRLNVIPIHIPPLRDRKEDIPMLVQNFLARLGSQKRVSTEAMRRLTQYDYPGNVRELENIIERAIALTPTNLILPEGLIVCGQEIPTPEPRTLSPVVDIPPDGLDLEKAIGDYEKAILLSALKRAGGVKKRAAELLKMSFRSFRYKWSKYRKEV